MSRMASTIAVVAGTGYVLLRFIPDPALVGELARPRAWLLKVGTDAAAFELAGALLWLAAAWLAFGLLATCASLLPGRIGRLGRSAATVTPPVIRRMVLATAGAAILVTPVASFADAPAYGSHSPTEVSSAAANPQASAQPTVPEPALSWPTDPPTSDSASDAPAATGSPTATTGTATAAPVRTGSGAPPATATLSDQNPLPASSRAARPSTSDPTPSSTTSFPTATGTTTSPGPATTLPPAPSTTPRTGQPNAIGADVTVDAGDSLWMIAAHRLGAEASAARIAAEWPRWYATNRALIGSDPDLIQPGTRLQPPAGHTATTEE